MEKKHLIYAGLGVAVIAIISYLNRQRKLLQAFGYELLGVTYLGTTDNVSKLEVKMKFTNTADFNIQLKGYKFDVLVDNRVVAKAEGTEVYNIPAKQSVIIPFIGNADTKLTLTLGISSLIEHFVDSTQSNATLRGTVNIKAGIVSIKNLPLEFSATTEELINELKT